MSELMSVWEHASETDTSATKSGGGHGGKSTSINGYWMFKKATELWGPCGAGWGYDILEDTFKDGIPILDKEGKTICMTVMHTLKIRLWYGTKGIAGVTQYGHTPYIMATKNGPMCDMEAPKKSLTDAIKKSLSMLGFSSDVYMGQFDDQEYVQGLQVKEFIEKADEKDEAIEQAQGTLIEYVQNNIKAIESAVTENEVKGIAKVSLRHLDRQRKIPDLTLIASKGMKAINKAAEEKKMLGNSGEVKSND